MIDGEPAVITDEMYIHLAQQMSYIMKALRSESYDQTLARIRQLREREMVYLMILEKMGIDNGDEVELTDRFNTVWEFWVRGN